MFVSKGDADLEVILARSPARLPLVDQRDQEVFAVACAVRNDPIDCFLHAANQGEACPAPVNDAYLNPRAEDEALRGPGEDDIEEQRPSRRPEPQPPRSRLAESERKQPPTSCTRKARESVSPQFEERGFLGVEDLACGQRGWPGARASAALFRRGMKPPQRTEIERSSLPRRSSVGIACANNELRRRSGTSMRPPSTVCSSQV